MTIYFTAANDDAAAAALKSAPSGEETLTSEITPSGDAFTALIELVWGKSLDDLPDDEAERSGVATTLTEGIARLGDALVSALADRDQGELEDLAGPWADLVPSLKADDLVDFLGDLQHLSRNAKANGGGVYAVESFS
jgi:hypothetical protein